MPPPDETGPKTPRVLLPADLKRALRHLGDDELAKLKRAVAVEVRRRQAPGSQKPAPQPAATTGQERLILAAARAGLKPAAIARELRLSRAKVDHVLAAQKRRP